MIDYENSTLYILNQITTAYRSILERAMNAVGLHGGQIFILIALWKNDGLSQVDIVNSLNLTAPTINKMVKSLVAGGFIKCRKCKNDGRKMRVYLTEKGFQCQSEVATQWTIVEDECFSSLTETEKLMVTHLFLKLREGFGINNSTDKKT